MKKVKGVVKVIENAVIRKKLKNVPKSATGVVIAHPDHARELPRLKRVRGQLDGIERMIGERRYCMDILQQIKAARAALQAFEAAILQNHLHGCLRKALTLKDSFDAEEKIQEIIKIFER